MKLKITNIYNTENIKNKFDPVQLQLVADKRQEER